MVNGGKLFEEVDEETGVVEDSKSIKEIKNQEKNKQLLQIQLKSLQEQINELKSNQQRKPKTQEYINRKTVKNPVSNVVFRCHIAMVNAQQCGKPNHFAKVCKPININPIQDGLFGAAHGRGWAKRLLRLYNLSQIFYNDQTWHSYTLPKDDPKSIRIT